jgi:H+-transporting ATPase
MAVARTDGEGQWHMLGLLTFLDPPRPDTKATLDTALHYGVQTRMVCPFFLVLVCCRHDNVTHLGLRQPLPMQLCTPVFLQEIPLALECEPVHIVMQITGDNVLIARETARALGMGTDIRTAELLPQMMDDGRMPPHLARDYGHIVLPADGFAQVGDAACAVGDLDACSATRSHELMFRHSLLHRRPHEVCWQVPPCSTACSTEERQSIGQVSLDAFLPS